MKTLKHTPGPWEAIGNSIYQVDSAPKLSYSGSEIAFRVSRHMESEEQDANAKLMAASPELLESLKKLISCVEEKYYSNELNEALIVIAKAEGKKS